MDGVGFLLIAALGLLVVMTFIRGSRQQRDIRRTQQSLAAGATVATGSGMIGTVVDISDDVVTLESTPGHRSRWYRAAIVRVIDTPDPAPSQPDATDAGDTPESSGSAGAPEGSAEAPAPTERDDRAKGPDEGPRDAS